MPAASPRLLVALLCRLLFAIVVEAISCELGSSVATWSIANSSCSAAACYYFSTTSGLVQQGCLYYTNGITMGCRTQPDGSAMLCLCNSGDNCNDPLNFNATATVVLAATSLTAVPCVSVQSTLPNTSLSSLTSDPGFVSTDTCTSYACNYRMLNGTVLSDGATSGLLFQRGCAAQTFDVPFYNQNPFMRSFGYDNCILLTVGAAQPQMVNCVCTAKPDCNRAPLTQTTFLGGFPQSNCYLEYNVTNANVSSSPATCQGSYCYITRTKSVGTLNATGSLVNANAVNGVLPATSYYMRGCVTPSGGTSSMANYMEDFDSEVWLCSGDGCNADVETAKSAARIALSITSLIILFFTLNHRRSYN